MSQTEIEILATRVISKYSHEDFWGSLKANRENFLKEVALDASTGIINMGLSPDTLGRVMASLRNEKITNIKEIGKNVEFNGNGDLYLVDQVAHFVACIIAKRYQSAGNKQWPIPFPKKKTE